MNTSKNLQKLAWVLQTIQKQNGITLHDINELWVNTEMSGGAEMSRTTLWRSINELGDTFGIYIECNRKTNQYYISNPEVLKDDSVQQWLLSTISASNIISESLSQQESILLEEIPVEGEMLRSIIAAMKMQRRIDFKYHSYWHEKPRDYTITPCCIKLFRQRWYVIAFNEGDQKIPFQPFALDRIRHLTITEQSFQLPKNFSAKAVFEHSYGIFVNVDTKPEHIIIRAYGNERKYLRDLPLHHSQEIRAQGEVQGEEYTDYRYFVCPTHDFISELMSKGDRIEVLSPESLRQQLCEAHLKAAERYK